MATWTRTGRTPQALSYAEHAQLARANRSLKYFNDVLAIVARPCEIPDSAHSRTRPPQTNTLPSLTV